MLVERFLQEHDFPTHLPIPTDPQIESAIREIVQRFQTQGRWGLFVANSIDLLAVVETALPLVMAYTFSLTVFTTEMAGIHDIFRDEDPIKLAALRNSGLILISGLDLPCRSCEYVQARIMSFFKRWVSADHINILGTARIDGDWNKDASKDLATNIQHYVGPGPRSIFMNNAWVYSHESNQSAGFNLKG